MLVVLFLILFYFTAPVLLIYLCKVSNTLNRIGSVVLAYALGLLIGNIGIFPSASSNFHQLLGTRTVMPKEEFTNLLNSGKIVESDILVNQIANVQDILMTIIIPLAIPLLLFSLDLRKWIKLAKGAVLSLILAMVSLIVSVFSGYYLFAENIDESWKVAGMLIGVYTGGTPNLAAIGTALDVSPNTFILTHTYDLIIGSVALLFLMTMAQQLFHTFLPRFGLVKKGENVFHLADETNDMDNFDNLFKKKSVPDLLKSLGLTILIFAVGGGLSLLVPKSSSTMVAILAITTLGLGASLIKRINRISNSFQFGMYLIIVFSLVVSSMANLSNMFQIEFLQLFLFVLLVVFGSMAIHVVLSRIFKVDADTTIIAITALTYSPPFVPAVAGALKNKNVIISGLTIGILGYAFGNYLGIFIATILH
ncbi:DUF819 family protein [Maribellus comscasis]|uniref:DUF819 family protein n=1 Tax=Maribellus comscasis TaxID=2681766 RepID=A0A6I6JZB9_9BACT|nr:DUF819 family protein [Maribellus comscasis]QGY46639.1 DUF819 family protein [Maribellus comscasis]